MMTPNSSHEEIRTALKNAIQLAPYHAPFWIDAGFYLLAIRDFKGAKESFEHAGFLEPNAPLPQYALALTYMKEGEKQKSAQVFKLAQDLKQKGEVFKGRSAYAQFLFDIPPNLPKG